MFLSLGVGKEDYPQTQGDFSFDEDSSDALSPDQPASQESQGSAASPSEPKVSDSPSPVTTNTPAQVSSFLFLPLNRDSALFFLYIEVITVHLLPEEKSESVGK